MNGRILQGSRRGECLLSVGLTVLCSLAFSAVSEASDPTYLQARNGGAETGDWGGSNGAVVGAPDGNCANMGAVGKVNLVSNFGFNLPADAAIGDITVYAKAGENDAQTAALQLATDASIEPHVTVGSPKNLSVFDALNGNCSSTAVTTVGGTLASWGANSGVINATSVNAEAFGLAFTKIETSSVKVDAICLRVTYTSASGQALTEECFPPPPLEENDITVAKEVIGTPPGSD